MTVDVDAILAQRYDPASFEGIPFDVERRSRSGRNNTTTVRVTGRGAREQITTGDEPTVWRVQGWLRRDEGPWADQLVLETAFALGRDYQRSGVYIDPFDGPQVVIPAEWDFESMSDDLDSIRISVTFKSAELPTLAPTPGFLASSPVELGEILVSEAGSFATEPEAAAQLEAVRSDLGIDTSVQGEEYAAASTRRLLSGAYKPEGGVPQAIQLIGSAARIAQSGEYTRDAFGALRGTLVSEAARSNSPTLLQFRETFSLFLSALGSDAFGTREEKPGRSLITISSTRSWPELVKRNRAAILDWRVRDTVRT